MNFFLLIAGDFYYPKNGTKDWIGTFKSQEEAQSQVEIGPEEYQINGKPYNWYEIVDLKKWITKNTAIQPTISIDGPGPELKRQIP